MDFLNSFISTFDSLLHKKKFANLYVGLLLFIMLFSFILNRLDINITDNDVIKNYQLSKIYTDDFNKVETIIVGDSSCGNGINDKLFTSLSGSRTENLCLNGSWGLVGSLGIIKKSLLKNKKIKNIIIIQTLDIWNRSFPKEAVLELFEISEIIDEINYKTIVGYLFNPKEIFWHLKYLLAYKELTTIDTSHDYVKQNNKKYSNNLRILEYEKNLNDIKLSNSKSKEIVMIDTFCRINGLNCIFLNGPIHNGIIKNSDKFISYLNEDIINSFSHIKYHKNIFSYPNRYIGDSLDHIDIKYKDEVTKDYYLLVKPDLMR